MHKVRSKSAHEYEQRSRSVERSHRGAREAGVPRRASSRERTPEKGHRSSRRHHRGEASRSPFRAAGESSDVRRSTGEADFRRGRERSKEESVDFQAIIRTQRAAWEREREKWRAEIAALQAQVERLKVEKVPQVQQNVSEETADVLAAPEQSDSPRIHSFPSPKSNGTSELRTSAEPLQQSRESLGGLRISGGSLHSQNDPLGRSTEGRAAGGASLVG